MVYILRFFSLQNAVCSIIPTCLVPVLFTFYIQGVLKLKKNNSGAKRLRRCMLFRFVPKQHSKTSKITGTSPNKIILQIPCLKCWTGGGGSIQIYNMFAVVQKREGKKHWENLKIDGRTKLASKLLFDGMWRRIFWYRRFWWSKR